MEQKIGRILSDFGF